MRIIEYLYSLAQKHKSKIKLFIPISFLRKIKKLYSTLYLKKILKHEKDDFKRKKYKDGINLIGASKEATGLGQSCRLLANELEVSDFNFSITNVETEKIFNDKYNLLKENNQKELKYNINLINIVPDITPFVFSKENIKLFNFRYNIGFFLWELEEIPQSWIKIINLYDEIWTPSEFCSESFRKKINIPVKTIPYSMKVEVNKKYNRKYFNLPNDKFLYLMMYDTNSIMERKNPLGVINAFKKAFKPDDDRVGLVIKIGNSTKNDISKLKKEISEYKNVYFVTESYSKIEVNSLINCVDVYVSLHKSEGFGLVLAEAMMLKTPTIATNWSANTEFMNDKVACMVDYEYEIITKNIANFKKGNRWANPNLDTASHYMIKLLEDKKFYNKIKTSAYKYINEKLCMQNVVSLINKRINNIYKESDNNDKTNKKYM